MYQYLHPPLSNVRLNGALNHPVVSATVRNAPALDACQGDGMGCENILSSQRIGRHPLGQKLGVLSRFSQPGHALRFGQGLDEIPEFVFDEDLLDENLKAAVRATAFEVRNRPIEVADFINAFFQDEKSRVVLHGILETLMVSPQEFQMWLENYIAQKNSGGVTQGVMPYAQGVQQLMEGLDALAKKTEAKAGQLGIPQFFEVLMTQNSSLAEVLINLQWTSALSDQESPLDKFSRDVTFMAKTGNMRPVIGRYEELSRLIMALGQDKKNSAIITGEAGAGKTALVYRLARILASGDLSTLLKGDFPLEGLPEAHRRELTQILEKGLPESLQRKTPSGDLIFHPMLKNAQGKPLPVGKRILELNWPLIRDAGADMGPNGESVLLRQILEEAERRSNEVILFVDDIQQMISSSSSSSNAMLTLKRALSDGKMKLIGATTKEAYQQRIANDETLARELTQVSVDIPSVNDTMTMMRGVKGYLEKFHKVTIRDEAIELAATMADKLRYTVRPDSAYEILDSACSFVRSVVGGYDPYVLQHLGNIEKLSLDIQGMQARLLEFTEDEKNGKLDLDSAIQKMEAPLMDLVEQGSLSLNDPGYEALVKVRETEPGTRISSYAFKDLMGILASEQQEELAKKSPKLRALAQFIELYQPKELALVRQKYHEYRSLGEVKRIAEQEVTRLQKRRQELQTQLIEKQTSERREPVVTPEDIRFIVSQKANIPLQKLTENLVARLQNMESIIGERLIGQEDAVKRVSQTIRRNKAGLSDGRKPIGSFFFLGPSGVGKTEMARALAEFMFDDPDLMVRIDMSEFKEPHSLARLIGSPPGYVGYDREPILETAIKNNPYRVILFDEIEKAHPNVYDLFLQILQEGQLTTGKGTHVPFKDTIIIVTSNVGTESMLKPFRTPKLSPKSRLFRQQYENLQDLAEASLVQAGVFRPEFLNRFDAKVAFHPLMNEHLEKIVDLQIQGLNKRLLQTEAKVQVAIDESARETIVARGGDFKYGARPIQRFINDTIEGPLSVGLLTKQYKPGQTILFTKDVIDHWLRTGGIESHADSP